MKILTLIRENPIESASFIVSICVTIISLIIYLVVWQTTVTDRVSADESNLNSQSMLLKRVNDTVNKINTRGQVTAQKVDDINDKVNLIYQNIK